MIRRIMRKITVIGVVAVALWLAGLWVVCEVFPSPRRAFGKYVCSPVPRSVHDITFQGNDLPVAFECQCFFRFSGSSNDLHRVIEARGLQKVDFSGMNVHASAPTWFVPKQPSNVGQCFRRFSGVGPESG